MPNSTVNFLAGFHETVCDLSTKLLFDKEQILHFHVITLYGSILEYASSMLILTKDGPKSSIPVVFRSLLDASLDLLNLCNDPKYGYRLEIDYLRGRKEFLGIAIRGENQYLKDIGEHPEVKKQHKVAKTRLKRLKEQGYTGIDMAEKLPSWI